MGHTYVGCDFWPTITANPVYVEFEPAVVIANGSSEGDRSLECGSLRGPGCGRGRVCLVPLRKVLQARARSGSP